MSIDARAFAGTFARENDDDRGATSATAAPVAFRPPARWRDLMMERNLTAIFIDAVGRHRPVRPRRGLRVRDPLTCPVEAMRARAVRACQWMRAPKSDLVHRVRQCLVQLCALTGPTVQDPASLSTYTRRLMLAVMEMGSK